jgi:hypothetical protein
MNTVLTNHLCDESNAAKCAEWIKSRHGVAIWPSINLSNLGASWSTPAETNGALTTKPTRQAANQPECVITSLDQIDVVTYEEVKHFTLLYGSAEMDCPSKCLTGGRAGYAGS